MNARPASTASDCAEMPNVLCTPHLGWAEHENFELYFGECFEQIARYTGK